MLNAKQKLVGGNLNCIVLSCSNPSVGGTRKRQK